MLATTGIVGVTGVSASGGVKRARRASIPTARAIYTVAPLVGRLHIVIAVAAEMGNRRKAIEMDVKSSESRG